jgi:hypothetical protein
MDTFVRLTPGESWPSTHRWSQCMHDARNSYAQYVPIGYRLLGRYLDNRRTTPFREAWVLTPLMAFLTGYHCPPRGGGVECQRAWERPPSGAAAAAPPAGATMHDHVAVHRAGQSAMHFRQLMKSRCPSSTTRCHHNLRRQRGSNQACEQARGFKQDKAH